MNDCNAIGARTALAVQGGSTPRTFSATSQLILHNSEDIGEFHLWGGGQRGVGDLDVTADANRRTGTSVFGVIRIPASPEELHRWLPRAMWGTVVGNVYSLGYAASNYGFDILADRENGMFRYRNCLVSKLVLSSQTSEGGRGNEMVGMEVHVVGSLETIDDTAWPSPPPTFGSTLDYLPYMHWESLLTVNAVDIPVVRWSLEIDNRLRPVGHNQLNPEKFRSRGRNISLSVLGKLSSSTLAEAVDVVTTPGSTTLSLVHTLAPMSCVVSLPNTRNTGWRSPSATSPGYIPLAFSLAPGKSTGSQMLITNDHAP
jgi:hypothetical protein